MPSPRALLLTSLTAALLSAAPAHAQTVTGRATVVDGATLEVRGTRIRLAGIDQVADDHVCERTDDEAWRCGPRAVNALDALLEESIVSCVVRERESRGQIVGTCSASGTDLGLWLIRNGLAQAAAAASSRYRQAEAEAKAARRGMWSVPGAVP